MISKFAVSNDLKSSQVKVISERLKAALALRKMSDAHAPYYMITI